MNTDQNKLELDPTMSNAMTEAKHYHDYQWKILKPQLGKRVLEIGVGYGQYTRRMLDAGCYVLACDIEMKHLRDLQNTISNAKLQTMSLDLQAAREEDYERARNFEPDTIVLMNVLEHLADPVASLKVLSSIAAPSCKLFILVPAVQVIYNRLDSEAGHYLRYNRKLLIKHHIEAGWDVVDARYLNMPGILGWVLAGYLSESNKSESALNAKSTNWMIRVYDKLFIGLSRITDCITARMAGLSLCCVSKKSSSNHS